MEKKKRTIANILFVLICGAIIIVLLRAPKESTAKLPNDLQHKEFKMMKSKEEAERLCGKCHAPDGIAPLPPDHPPKYRCLFCHKRN